MSDFNKTIFEILDGSKIAVGSASPIKTKAISEVFYNSIIQGYAVDSGVPPQPRGKEETRKGALNRARNALNVIKDSQWSIGIENGMWKVTIDDENDNEGEISEGGWVDGAVIVGICRNMDQKHVEVWSETIEIPKILPFERGPNGEWSILKDPHDVLTKGKKSRKEFLVECLKKFGEIKF